MSIVFCRSCKAKITQHDQTCPKCGSPTSRLIPFLFLIVFSAVGLVLYTAYQESNNNNRATVANVNQSSADVEDSPQILQTGLSEQ